MKQVYLKPIEKMECPECGCEVDTCDKCGDFLVINEATFCIGDLDHYCTQCAGELQASISITKTIMEK